MRILLAEDDTLLGEGLRAGLQQLGFQVDWVHDGIAAELELRANPYAACVLDLSLPLKDGLSVLTAIRGAGVTLPVLVLTARTRCTTGSAASMPARTTTWSSRWTCASSPLACGRWCGARMASRRNA